MNEVVTKPFAPAELFGAIATWLRGDGETAPDADPATAEDGGPVSFSLGLSRCLGRHDLHRRVLQRFVDTRAQDAVLLREAKAAGDAAALLRLAHTTISRPPTRACWTRCGASSRGTEPAPRRQLLLTRRTPEAVPLESPSRNTV
jgi:two-component system sensor histidine kinase/response regulator